VGSVAAKNKHRQNKPHGNFCKVCCAHKPNEKFSGKGHAAHICRKCAALPVAKRNEMMDLRRIMNMAFRYLSKKEIEWLRGKMDDPRPEISKAARGAYNFKFPHHERNIAKKGLTALSLEFYVHCILWDEYGDELPEKMRFYADNSGEFRRIDYSAPEDVQEDSINIGQPAAQKFLNSVVHQLNAPFWSDELSDSGVDEYNQFDPTIDILPKCLPDYDEEYAPDISGDDDNWYAGFEAPLVEKEPIWSLRLVLNKGIGEKTQTFYNQMHEEPRELFWSLMELFEPDEGMDADEPEY